MRTRLYLPALLFATACSDPPKPPPDPPPAPKPAAAAAPKAAAPAAPAKPLTVLEAARARALTKDDFTESDNNRDPFHSFLQSFANQQPTVIRHKIILDKFAVEELRLAGIVTGEMAPKAMFIDPAGNGVTVVRGDHISKSDALITRIAPDRVYLRIEEDTGTDKARVTEREIQLHAGEVTQ